MTDEIETTLEVRVTGTKDNPLTEEQVMEWHAKLERESLVLSVDMAMDLDRNRASILVTVPATVSAADVRGWLRP